jgi:inhibitor of KinA
MAFLAQPISIFSLGDSAITIDMGNRIDEGLNRMALAIRDRLRDHDLDDAILDIVVAYSSVSVFYDPVKIKMSMPDGHDGIFGYMKQKLEAVYREESVQAGNGKMLAGVDGLIRIPVCYAGEYGPDLDEVSKAKGISPQEVVSLHCSRTYRVYMIGFLPGFPYLARLDERLTIRRKDRPVPVTAGGVGIAGDQTGIYTLNSPGGWQIIGRTPLNLFDASAAVPVLLKTGDQVQFFPVTTDEFLRIAAQRD